YIQENKDKIYKDIGNKILLVLKQLPILENVNAVDFDFESIDDSKETDNFIDYQEPIEPLSQQKEFKSINNYIIYEEDTLSKEEINLTGIDEVKQAEFITDIFTKSKDVEEKMKIFEHSAIYVKWTDDYKKARTFLFGAENNEPNFDKALELLQAESQKGNILAVFDLARMYADGLDMEIDLNKAHEYYAQALYGFKTIENQKPWKYLEYRIGKMYAQGLGTEQDYELAAEWFEKSASQKYKFAEYSLGGLFYRGQGVEQSYEKAFDLYLHSAKQGFPYADFEVAKMFRDGIGTEKDEKQSNHHFEKAYVGFVDLEKQSHDDKIQYRLGWMLQNAVGTEKNIPKAKEYFEKSAKLGNTFACYSLAKLILAEDNQTAQELQTALKYLQTASDSGNQFAQYTLGKLYLEGEHLEQNIAKAVELFSLSAQQGNEWADYTLGKIYLSEVGYIDIAKAIEHLNKSAERGNQFAQYTLAGLYYRGENIEQNYKKAFDLYLRSANKGFSYAEFEVGKMYQDGIGIEKDQEKSDEYFKRAFISFLAMDKQNSD
ncbi:MAG: SEL1-like repeat protein, partial [Oscillospiraceae bacterium]